MKRAPLTPVAKTLMEKFCGRWTVCVCPFNTNCCGTNGSVSAGVITLESATTTGCFVRAQQTALKVTTEITASNAEKNISLRIIKILSYFNLQKFPSSFKFFVLCRKEIYSMQMHLLFD